MATSSSAKKVARLAAKSGGGANANKQANWIFPMAIGAILILGIGIVAFARSENSGTIDASAKPRAQLSEGQASDHWHASYAISICGKEQPALADGAEGGPGIHTHQDGLIHIHPFSLRASGTNATMKRFFDQTRIAVTNAGMKLQDGKVYKVGETKCGGKPAELVMAHWKSALDAPTTKPDQIFTKDFEKVRFTENYGAYTLAFVPKGTRDIPAPSTAAQVKTLGACDGKNPPAACSVGAGGAPAASVPGGGG